MSMWIVFAVIRLQSLSRMWEVFVSKKNEQEQEGNMIHSNALIKNKQNFIISVQKRSPQPTYKHFNRHKSTVT